MASELKESWSSKKLAFGLLSVVLIFAGWAMSAHWSALQPQYMTMVGGITGIFALFVGGNVTNQLVASKHVVALKALQSATAEEEPAPGTGGSAAL